MSLVVTSYSILHFFTWVFLCPVCMFILQKEWRRAAPHLSGYPFSEKLGIAVIYLGTQVTIFAFLVTGDTMLSLRPAGILFAGYLFYQALIKI